MMNSPAATIREHISLQSEDPIRDEESELCTTVEGESEDGASFWIQLHGGLINFQHLADEEKEELLGDILDPLPVGDDATCEDGVYLTFTVMGFSGEEVDILLDELINDYFSASAQQGIRCKTESF